MKKLIIAALLASPLAAFAAGENNVGCGLGSAIWAGQKGIVPQILAATTNGTSGNHGFSVHGCSSDSQGASAGILSDSAFDVEEDGEPESASE